MFNCYNGYMVKTSTFSFFFYRFNLLLKEREGKIPTNVENKAMNVNKSGICLACNAVTAPKNTIFI